MAMPLMPLTPMQVAQAVQAAQPSAAQAGAQSGAHGRSVAGTPAAAGSPDRADRRHRGAAAQDQGLALPQPANTRATRPAQA
jgi:flagellar hook-length control protein FliK